MTLPLVNGLRSSSTTAEHPACSFGCIARPTAMEDAAVNRLAKSITQLHCVKSLQTKLMPPPNCSTRHVRSFEVSQTSHPRGSLTFEAATRQLRQLSCILDSCTISASYEVSQAQKAILLMPRTAKGASTSSEELNAQISPRTDEEHNLPAHEDYWQEY